MPQKETVIISEFLKYWTNNLLNILFPVQFAEVNGQIPKVTGLGFLVVIALVFVVGWLSSLYFMERLVSVFDKVLERTPGIKIIYS